MRVRLTDQAAVAVALARQIAGAQPPTTAHLLVGLAGEPEGRAGRRLRERPTAAAGLAERAATTPAPPLDAALQRAARSAGTRAVNTIDLLDAALGTATEALATVLDDVGYQRDLDGWVLADPDGDWFDDAETFGLDPFGDVMNPDAARIVAQVRAVDGGAVELLMAAAAAPGVTLPLPDPAALATAAAQLPHRGADWDHGLDTVMQAATQLSDNRAMTVDDLVRAALIVGGDGPRLVIEFASDVP